MSESTPPADATPQTSPQTQQVRLRVDHSKTQLCYANAFRSNVTNEELVIDLGLNEVTAAPQPGEGGEAVQGEAVFHVGSRVVLSYPSAKRLMLHLGQLIHNYESRYGEIRTGSGPRS